jgi:hypothetical protein
MVFNRVDVTIRKYFNTLLFRMSMKYGAKEFLGFIRSMDICKIF